MGYAAFPPDAVVSCLVFSEMPPPVQRYVLSTVLSRLRPGARLVIADEVVPDRAGQRVWYRVRRAPVMAVTWLLTQTGTRPVKDLVGSIAQAGFIQVETERPWASFLIVSALKPS